EVVGAQVEAGDEVTGDLGAVPRGEPELEVLAAAGDLDRGLVTGDVEVGQTLDDEGGREVGGDLLERLLELFMAEHGLVREGAVADHPALNLGPVGDGALAYAVVAELLLD